MLKFLFHKTQQANTIKIQNTIVVASVIEITPNTLNNWKAQNINQLGTHV